MTALVVEDHPVVAVHLRALLKSHAHADIAGSLAEAVTRLEQGGVGVILLDLNLPDSSGLDTVRAVMAAAPGVPVVVMTATDDENLAIQAMEIGAQDYLIKGEDDGRRVRRAVQYAVERHKNAEALRQRMAEAEASPECADSSVQLTPRERDCLLLLAQGLRTERIGERMNISAATAEFHLRNARRKLGAATREQALIRAAMLGLIRPSSGFP